MPNFSQEELNSIRESVMCHTTMSAKLKSYANSCNDKNIRQMFSQTSQQAQQAAEKLTQML